MVSRAVYAALVIVCTAAGAAAQAEPPPLPSRSLTAPIVAPLGETPAQQMQALEEWTQAFEKWQNWFARWHNQSEPGWFAAKGRLQKPTPPQWLPAACESPVDDSGPLARGCQLWDAWRRDEGGQSFSTQQVAQARANREVPHKTIWWEHIHLDALWPITQVGSGAFGVAGAHTTLSLTKRAEVFLTPGVLMMRVPALTGGSTWTAATDWGFSYRLGDFRMPGFGTPSTLHLNMARVWLLGQNELPLSGQLYVAGLSLTFRSGSRP